MKPIRNYSDGQWLLLLWAFVLLFLATGIFLGSTLLTIVAVLGALGAAYTTFLYLRANGFTLPVLEGLGQRRGKAASSEDDEDDEDDEDEYDEGEYDEGDYDEEQTGVTSGARPAPVVDSFERPANPPTPQRSDAPTSPDLSEGDPR